MRQRALQLLGRTVRRLRKQRNLSQERLAELAGVHLNHVSSIERGERNPGLLTILKLSRGLSVHPNELLSEFPPSTVKRMRLS